MGEGPARERGLRREGARMLEKSCDTCAHKSAESVDDEGNRIVDCDANDLQMYSPWAEDCKHWEKSLAQD